jgi:mycothiol system anti-sigma-R factor
VSCGKPHETPCSEVLEDVYLYLDQECDRVSTAKIRQHLDECSPCLAEYGIEQEVKALVGRCCGQETAPDGLKQRLRATLQQVVISESDGAGHQSVTVEVTHVEITTETDR